MSMRKKERDLQNPLVVCPNSPSLRPCCFETVLLDFSEGPKNIHFWVQSCSHWNQWQNCQWLVLVQDTPPWWTGRVKDYPSFNWLVCFLSDTPHPAKEILYSSEACRTVPAAGAFVTCNHNHIATTAAATSMTLNQVKPEPTPALNCNPAHPLLHINTLYEDHEEDVSNIVDNGIHSPTDTGEILSIPTPKQIRLATFDEPMAIVSSVEYWRPRAAEPCPRGQAQDHGSAGRGPPNEAIHCMSMGSFHTDYSFW